MKIGFGKANLIDAVDWQATFKSIPSTPEKKDFSREEKFDISDRVMGMWRPEEGGKRTVIEPMHISVLYSEDINGPFVLTAIDHCDLEYHDLDLIRQPIISQCGVPEQRIVFLPSHCHVTVIYDKDKLKQVIVTAVHQAKAGMVEVEIGFLNLKIAGKKFIINRRIDVEGIGTRTIMFNDFCDVKEDHLDATDQVKEWIQNLGGNPSEYMTKSQRFVTHRKVEDRLKALIFRNKKTKQITGSFVRFSAHAVIVSEKKVQGDISADYPGYLKKRLESQLGGIALFAQGLSGDLRPLNRVYSHQFAEEYGLKLADMIITNISDSIWHPVERIEFFAESIRLPLRKDLPKNNEEGQEQMKRIEKLYDKTNHPEKRRKLQNDFWFYYRSGEVARLLRPQWREQGFIDAFQFGLKINDIAMVMNPGELFYSTGLQMIEPYQGKNTIILGIANEYISYIPPRDDIARGGYEPSVCLLDPESSRLLVDYTHKLLEKMIK
jgi:hypothetical protein